MASRENKKADDILTYSYRLVFQKWRVITGEFHSSSSRNSE